VNITENHLQESISSARSALISHGGPEEDEVEAQVRAHEFLDEGPFSLYGVVNII
jgi:hypothetical protein